MKARHRLTKLPSADEMLLGSASADVSGAATALEEHHDDASEAPREHDSATTAPPKNRKSALKAPKHRDNASEALVKHDNGAGVMPRVHVSTYLTLETIRKVESAHAALRARTGLRGLRKADVIERAIKIGLEDPSRLLGESRGGRK